MPSRHFSWVSCLQLGIFSVPLSFFSRNLVPYLTVLTSQLFCVSVSLPLFSLHHNLTTPHLWISLCIWAPGLDFTITWTCLKILHLWALTFWVAGVIGLYNQMWFYMVPVFFLSGCLVTLGQLLILKIVFCWFLTVYINLLVWCFKKEFKGENLNES